MGKAAVGEHMQGGQDQPDQDELGQDFHDIRIDAIAVQDEVNEGNQEKGGQRHKDRLDELDHLAEHFMPLHEIGAANRAADGAAHDEGKGNDEKGKADLDFVIGIQEELGNSIHAASLARFHGLVLGLFPRCINSSFFTAF